MVLTVLFGLVTSSSCADKNFKPPIPLALGYPLQVAIEQVGREYEQDPIQADAKYKGKRLIFNSIEVEEVHTIYYQSGGAIAVTMVDYFRAGMIRFELLDYLGAQQRVQPGFILNLDGVCQGLQGNLVNILDCWVSSVKGDLGLDLPPAIGY